MGFEILLGNILYNASAYNILVFLGLLTAVGIVLIEWRHSKNSDLKSYLLALGGTALIHLMAALFAQPAADATAFTAALLATEELLSVLLLIWAFGKRYWQENARNTLGIMLTTWAVVFVILLFMPQTLAPLIGFALTAIVACLWTVIWVRSSSGDILAAISFAILGVGALLCAMSVPTGGRLLFVIGYPLFAVSLYNAVLADLASYRQELQALSNEALRQSQELLFLIEATRSIGESFDVRELVGDVADNIAMALRAHTVLILLVDEDDPALMNVVASYQVLGGRSNIPDAIEVRAFPILATVLESREQLILSHGDDLTPARPFFELASHSQGGIIIVQPLIRKGRLLGILTVINGPTQPAFTHEQGLLATTIGVQIASAVENTHLYKAVQSKAEEFHQLLTLRDAELLREEAILESMAEGILVIDAQGYFTLMNRAAEEILDTVRADILGRNVQDALDMQPFSVGFNPADIVSLDEDYQTTFNLGERRIRIHAAPALTPDKDRLGIVAILQDITREYLAEESKREFIASISHELRTPLTAIKGYTEVMLSGLAGELPPAFGQFLGVIRENTTRMTSLTNNIISIAEIEQGRVGLNYQESDVPDIIHELLGRYQERVEERMLDIKLDFPENLSQLEVDPHRLRLILDNLISNAIKYTYPNGRITLGCRDIQGTLGRPTFFSIWVSDTGIGIPIDAQNRIWERFYRVDSPLSIEAGGLGIGLTITKALVEAHGGRVWVDSTLDEGSTFTVLLPIYRSQGAIAELDLEAYW